MSRSRAFWGRSVPSGSVATIDASEVSLSANARGSHLSMLAGRISLPDPSVPPSLWSAIALARAFLASASRAEISLTRSERRSTWAACLLAIWVSDAASRSSTSSKSVSDLSWPFPGWEAPRPENLLFRFSVLRPRIGRPLHGRVWPGRIEPAPRSAPGRRFSSHRPSGRRRPAICDKRRTPFPRTHGPRPHCAPRNSACRDMFAMSGGELFGRVQVAPRRSADQLRET